MSTKEKTTKETTSKKKTSSAVKKKSSVKAKPKEKESLSAESDITVLDQAEAEEINLDLESSIDKLLEEKQSLIRPDAIEAKENYDEIKNRIKANTPKKVAKQIANIDGFSENVQVLSELFRRSKFDEYLVLLSNPQRVLTVNFMIGIFRGMGFMIGAGIVSGLFYYFTRAYFPF